MADLTDKSDAATTATAETAAASNEALTNTTAAKAPAAAVAADDDESDWEDLDEVLDDFNKPEQPQKTLDAESSAPSLATNAAAPPSLPVAGDFDEDAFLKQLEADMANLMGGGGGTGGGPPVAAAANNAGPGNVEAPAANQSLDTEIEELSKMLKDSGIEPEKFLGALLAESMKPGDAEPKEEAGSSSVDTAGERGSFQDTIRQTMNRMQESGDRATAAATTESDIPADLLAQLIQAMEAGTSAEGEDADINKLFAGMMEQLSNKEMLYEPMKELHTKFGPWLEENRTKVSAKDRARYETHAQLVGEIVAKFDEEGYSDDKPEDRSYIWDRMQAMQATGSPPEELIANPFSDDYKIPPDCAQQ